MCNSIANGGRRCPHIKHWTPATTTEEKARRYARKRDLDRKRAAAYRERKRAARSGSLFGLPPTNTAERERDFLMRAESVPRSLRRDIEDATASLENAVRRAASDPDNARLRRAVSERETEAAEYTRLAYGAHLLAEGRLTVSLTDAQRERIANMDAAEFSTELSNLRSSMDVQHVVCEADPRYIDIRPEAGLTAIQSLGEVTDSWVSGKCAKEISAVTDAIAAFDSEPSEDGWRAMRKASDTLAAARREAVASLLSQRGEEAVQIQGEVDANRKALQRNLFDAARLYPDAWKRAANEAGGLTIKHTRKRAHYTHNATVEAPSTLNVGNSPHTMTHELAHHMQMASPHVAAFEAAYRRSRSDGGAEAYGSDSEDFHRAGFANVYVGRAYGTGDDFPGMSVGGVQGSEVLPVGMEMLCYGRYGGGVGADVAQPENGDTQAEGTSRIASDPDHLKFVLGLLATAR